jgi:SecD/SecF fusion protein
MPQNYTGRILVILAVVLAFLWAIFPKPLDLFRSDLSWGEKMNLKPGIDMQGGTSLLYEIKPPEGEEGAATTYRGGLAEEVMTALKRRVDPNGVSSLIWRPHGDTRLEIQMPATAKSQQAEALGQELNAAREALEQTNVTPGEVTAAVERSPDAATRERELARLAGGSAARTAVFAELTAAWDKLQQARAAQDAVAAADAQEAYAKARARIEETNLRPGDLEAALELRQPDRQTRLEAIRKAAADFPARQAALDKYVASFDAFAKVRDEIDDVADLKRKLRGAGVLEFHILAEDAAPAQVEAMRQRITAEGPRSRAGDEMKWFEVEDRQRLEELDRQNKDRAKQGLPAITELSFFQGVPAATYNGKTYALAWITKEKSMDHRAGTTQWALRGARKGTGELGEAIVHFSFDPVGGQLFGDLSGSNINRPLAMILDQKIISAPNLRARITDSGIIEGNFTPDDIDYLVNTLNAGSLKAQLADEPISERTVGPQLGADNLRRGLIACLFGLVVVAVFLTGYYYLSGVVATVAVLLNMVIILGAMALFNATFTLPSIAGIVLTIGMAVDANVLIFERLREEQVRGLSLRMALRNAYDRAFSAILDGNVTTGITAAVLYIFGSEEVKGFGLTLLIGIFASLFTALFVTKTIFGILIDRFEIRRLGSLPLTYPRWDRALRPDVDWMGKAWIAYAFSGVVIVLGLTAFGVRLAQGRMLDVEFTKGTSVQFDLVEPMEQDEVRELFDEQSRKTPDALPSPQVVTSGGGNVSYEVITPNESAAQVRQAVVDALGGRLKVEQPSSFANVGASLDAAMAAGAVVPIEGGMQEVAGLAIDQQDLLAKHVGGAAIVLKNLRPPLPAAEVKTRIQRQRLQAESNAPGAGYRAFDVVDAPGRGPEGENTVVVLVSDPAFPHDADPLKLQQWKDGVAAPMWQTVNDAVNKAAELQRVTNFDAQVAGETQRDAFIAMFLSILFIMAYIWVRFGNLKYGTATVVALLHDTLFVLAAVGLAHYLAELSVFRDLLLIEPFRLNLTMVAAILTVMGYSMNDTVVVFDRIRENRGRLGVVSRQVINDSINQTLSRTLLTGGTTLLTILVMYVWGGSGIHGFTFALFIGIIVGTYSSIMIAAPILLFGQGRDTGGERRSSQEVRKTDRPAAKLEGVGAS